MRQTYADPPGPMPLTWRERIMYDALKRAVPWLGKLVADGGHLNSVAPNDAIGALQQAEAALAKVDA